MGVSDLLNSKFTNQLTTNNKQQQKKIMKTITKHFDTLKKATNYRNRLYNKYDDVQLLSFPVSSEKGIYVFLVNN